MHAYKPRCQSCRRRITSLHHTCTQCKQKFCTRCRLPEVHNCLRHAQSNDEKKQELAAQLLTAKCVADRMEDRI